MWAWAEDLKSKAGSHRSVRSHSQGKLWLFAHCAILICGVHHGLSAVDFGKLSLESGYQHPHLIGIVDSNVLKLFGPCIYSFPRIAVHKSPQIWLMTIEVYCLMVLDIKVPQAMLPLSLWVESFLVFPSIWLQAILGVPWLIAATP